MLQVLFIAIFFALSLQLLGSKGERILSFIDVLTQLLFKFIGLVMKFAPLGAFGAMAFTVGKYGLGTMLVLGQFMLAFYTTCLIFIFVVLGLIARLTGFSILAFIRYLKEELLLVFGFSSSEPVLPRFIAKMENLGCSESVVGLVIPTGYSFNLDGTAIYLTMAAVFLAQATNTDLSIWQQIGILMVLLLTSKGAAAVTGSGFIVLAATLGAVGHIPVASLALILGIDRFMSEARALTNFIGTGVATIVVAKWDGELDEARMRTVLAGKADYEAEERKDLFGAGHPDGAQVQHST
jgi:aerobic C4-dicarboxylate transport protein